MGQVTVLAHDDYVVIDKDRIGSLYTELGQIGAENAITRAMEELANRLSLLERCYYRDDRKGVAKAARSLVGIAEQVGLTRLAEASVNVANSAAIADEATCAAVVGRLVRVGDRSLSVVWEHQVAPSG